MSAFTRALATNNYGPAKFVVDGSVTANGTHSTIQAAIDSASSGDTIFIRPKASAAAYSENLTLKAGVNLCAYGCDSSLNATGHVIISGTCTLTTAGTVTISGIQLQTNAAALLAVTGTLASKVNLENCYLNCTNNSGITYSTSSATSAINIRNCSGDLGTTGINLFAHSSAGLLSFYDSDFLNSGNSTTASTCSAGFLRCYKTQFRNPYTSSGTAATNCFYSIFDGSNAGATNAIGVTEGGSGNYVFCSIFGGTASAVSIGNTSGLYQCNISSSNSNMITGAGTVQYDILSTSGSSSTINTTTQTTLFSLLGKYRATGQPAFLGTGGIVANVTGTGGAYTLGSSAALTEVYDQNNDFNTNGTFTAPITGRYQLSALGYLTGCTVNVANITNIVTSNRTYSNNVGRAASGSDLSVSLTILADMDAADTATVTIAGFGEAGVTEDIGVSLFSGILLA